MAKKAEKKEVVLTEAQSKVWTQIKDLNVEYFGLSNQHVQDVCTPVNVDPQTLYLRLKATAALVAVETAVASIQIKDWNGNRVAALAVEPMDKDVVAIVDNPALKIGGKKF